ncbi:WD40 repeat domain-containing protein [Streptomyces sp. NPDC002057]|uniref:WD40 repeat domain-containing protein n=1 Tax=Streptomyces sp. NPDC002057 TaxID=3154664 RepID=UPI00332B8CE0
MRENKSAVTSTSWGDGSRLLAAAVQGRAEVWDVRSGELVFAADAAADGGDVALSADGRRLALCVAGVRHAPLSLPEEQTLWDVRTRRPLPGLPVPYDAHVARSVRTLAPVRQNGTPVVYAILSGNQSELIDLTRGQRIVGLPNGPSAMAIRPDGKLLAVRRRGTGAVTALAFSADGKTLATGDELGRVRLWDVESRKALGTALLGSGDDITGLAFGHDGRTLRSQGRNTPLQEHRVAPEDVAAALCSRLGGGLDRREWRERIPEAPYRRACAPTAGPGPHSGPVGPGP